MEEKIQKAETHLETLSSQLALPEITSQPSKLLEITQAMGKLQKEIEAHYVRWAELLK